MFQSLGSDILSTVIFFVVFIVILYQDQQLIVEVLYVSD